MTTGMTKTKKISIITAVVIFALLIISILLPKSVTRETTVDLKTAPTFIQTLLKNKTTLPYWYPKLMDDTIQNKTFDTGDSLIYFANAKYGQGKLSSIKFSGDSCSFRELYENDIKTEFIIKLNKVDNTNSELKIKATRETGYLKNLWNFVSGYKLKKELKTIGKNIRNELEKRSENNMYYKHTIEQISLNKKYFVLLKSKVPYGQKLAYYSQNITSVYQSVQDAGIITINSPCLLNYGSLIDNQMDIAASLETVTEVNIKGLETKVFESGLGAKIPVSGPRENFKDIYKALEEYASDRNLKITLPIIEEYVTNPSQEADQSKWKTNVLAYYSAIK